MTEASALKELQYAFTQHMRDPDNAPAPADVEERRVEIYRGLLYRNVESFMANSYPVLRKITDDDRWHKMIRDYFKNHQSHTPYFPKMPREFLDYLEHERDDAGDPPFLYELAHYEWVEMAVAIDPREINWQGVNRDGRLEHEVPVLNPLIWPLAYQYPVHKIGPGFLPDAAPAQATYLVVFRKADDEVSFIELNPVAARLLELMQQNQAATSYELLQTIAEQIQHPQPETVVQGGLQIMHDMWQQQVILGTRK